MLVPANQYEIERLMREGWRLQFDPSRRVGRWRLWKFPFVDRTNILKAHGRSARAVLKAGKIAQAVPATRTGIVWYVWGN